MTDLPLAVLRLPLEPRDPVVGGRLSAVCHGQHHGARHLQPRRAVRDGGTQEDLRSFAQRRAVSWNTD